VAKRRDGRRLRCATATTRIAPGFRRPVRESPACHGGVPLVPSRGSLRGGARGACREVERPDGEQHAGAEGHHEAQQALPDAKPKGDQRASTCDDPA
jgi:hypothetical protein